MSTDRQQLPQVLYLFGGGRHQSTKALRRAARFKPRVFDIGEITIRPNRRVDVNVEFVVAHFDQILAHIKTGQLLIQHSADRFVDTDELRAIRAVFLGEPAPGPIVKLVDEDEPDDDVIDNPEDDESVPDPALAQPAPPAEPEADPLPPVDDGPNPAELAFGSDDGPPAAAEPVQTAPEPVEAPEAVQDPFEAEDAPQDLAEAPVDAPAEEPTEETVEAAPALAEDAPPADEPEAERRWLPDGYEKLKKPELLKLCEERGIVVEAKRVGEKKLVELLTSWKKNA